MLADTASAQNGNSINTAWSLGTLNSPISRAGRVDSGHPVDFYQFVVSGNVREVVALATASPSQAGVKLSLVRDANGDGIEEELESIDAFWGNSAWVSLWLDPGTYYVEVRNSGSIAANYDLVLSQTNRPASPGNGDNSLPGASALALGASATDFVGTNDVSDYHRFQVQGQVTEVTALLEHTADPTSSRSSPGGKSVALLQDLNNDGVPEELISVTSIWGNSASTFLWLDPGTYYARVQAGTSQGGFGNGGYRLTLSGTAQPASPGTNDNRHATARLLRVGEPVVDFVGRNDPVDYYRFSFSGPAANVSATVQGSSLSADVEVALLAEGTAGSPDNVLAYRASIFRNDVTVSMTLNPGAYYVRVRQANANQSTRYRLGLSAPPPPPPEPVIVLAGNLDFGNIVVGDTATRTLTIRNNGTTNLNVSGVSYPTGFSGPFFIGAVPVGGATELLVTFTPSGIGTFTGNIQVTSNARLGEDSITVRGVGAPVPTRILSLVGTLDFGGVEINRSASRTLTLVNTGNSPLGVNYVSFPGGFSGGFSGTIPPGASRPMTVVFSPLQEISYSGQVVVTSDKTSGENTVPVSGHGTPELPRILGLSGNLNFGSIEAGLSTNRMLILTNSGAGPIEVFSITFPPGFSNAFRGQIPAGQSRSLLVRFEPREAGVYGGTIVVNCDYNGGSNSIEAVGTASPVRPRVISLSSELNFGEVAAGRTATRTLTIANLGVAPLVVKGISYPNGFRGQFSGTIQPGRSNRVTVTFAPTAPGLYGGGALVNSDRNEGDPWFECQGVATNAPLFPAAGTFRGLFYVGDVLDFQKSGFFVLTVTARGGYSVVVYLGGVTYRASGQFGENGQADTAIQRAGLSPLQIHWIIGHPGIRLVSGTIGSADWEAPLICHQPETPATGSGGGRAGRYTVLCPGGPGVGTLPQGAGFGTVTLTAKGAAKLVCRLPDGTSVTQGIPGMNGGNWPLYAALYKKRGFLLGWILVSDSPNGDLVGSVRWIRPEIPTSGAYPAGFAMETPLVGRWYAPATGKLPRALPFIGARLTFSGGGLAGILECPINLGPSGRVTNAGSHQLRMTITNKTGLFSGSFTPPGDRKPIKFQGAIQQSLSSPGQGAGYFLRSNVSGHVALDIAP